MPYPLLKPIMLFMMIGEDGREESDCIAMPPAVSNCGTIFKTIVLLIMVTLEPFRKTPAAALAVLSPIMLLRSVAVLSIK